MDYAFFSLKLYDDDVTHRLKCYFCTLSIMRMSNRVGFSLALWLPEGENRANFGNMVVIINSEDDRSPK